MPPKLHLEGQKINRLQILRYVGTDGRNSMFECLCDCGNKTTASGYRIKNGHVKSCGCLQREKASAYGKTQGIHYMSKSREYSSWRSMIRRCYSEKSEQYENYGGRGISVYPTWRTSFEEFYKYLGPRPAGQTLDRINPNGNYEPGNVRWLSVGEQNRNRRKFCVLNKFTTKELLEELAKRGDYAEQAGAS